MTLTLAVALLSAAPDLRRVLEDFPHATAFRYGLKDDQGASMDCLKVVPSPKAGYLGVYHTLEKGAFTLKIARSMDLLNWRWVVDLDRHAHQGTLFVTNRSFIVAFEKDGPRRGNWIRVRQYEDQTSLYANRPSREFDAPNTLSKFAEGTPNVLSYRQGERETVLELGMHYYRDGVVDRQARATLTNWTTWKAAKQEAIDRAVEAFGVAGNIGDRDALNDQGRSSLLIEGMKVKDDWSSWGLYLVDRRTNEAAPVRMNTHRGSRSFANPTVTECLSPQGRRCLVVTLFLPSQGSAEGESGELLFYRELES
ncbi:MAG: hypothetical protein KIS66_15235 [Fimbriimonadaceae bacterium]|nr:hypothetical protein [Fimbriimonadaceae bacterium]